MRKLSFLSMLCCLLLPGCADQARSNFHAAGDKEGAAWLEMTRRDTAECSGLAKARETILKYQECESKLFSEIILPNAVFPDLAMEVDAKSARIGQNYFDGKISKEEYVTEHKELYADYAKQINERAGGVIQQAEVRDENRRARMSAMSQSMLNQPRPEPRQPTNIMCMNNPMASGTMPNPTFCQSY